MTSAQNEGVRNAAFLAALSLIDSAPSGQVSSDQPTPNTSTSTNPPALALALRQLISACADTRQPVHPTPEGEEEIVVLDKENVNPTSFRRRAEREQEKQSGPHDVPAQSSHLLPLSTQSNRPTHRSQPDSARSFSQPLLSSSSQGRTSTRKRRLSDVGGDDTRRVRKGKEKESQAKDVENIAALTSSELKAYRHYPRLMAAAGIASQEDQSDVETEQDQVLVHPHPRTSPVRKEREVLARHVRADPSTSPPRKAREIVGQQVWTHPSTSPPRKERELATKAPSIQDKAPRVSASSPVRGPQRPLKRYVVPEWARTNTALQPRLSQQKQQELKDLEAKQEEAKTRRKYSLNSKRRKGDALKTATSLPKNDGPSRLSNHSLNNRFLAPTVNSNLPVIASSDPLAPPIVSISPPPATHASASTPAPQTPPRKRRTSGEQSLFTPGPSGSPLFSPSPRKPRPSLQEFCDDHIFSNDDTGMEIDNGNNSTTPRAGSTTEPWYNPPSSPLPPSSPPPMSSQDIEPDTDDIGSPLDFMSDAPTGMGEYTPVQTPTSEPDSEPSSSQSTDSTAPDSDLFDLFMNFEPSAQSPSPADPKLGENEMTDFDLSQFWESFKPLLEQQGVVGQQNNSDMQGAFDLSFDKPQGFEGDIDHEKLADEVHALFSGCLC